MTQRAHSRSLWREVVGFEEDKYDAALLKIADALHFNGKRLDEYIRVRQASEIGTAMV